MASLPALLSALSSGDATTGPVPPGSGSVNQERAQSRPAACGQIGIDPATGNLSATAEEQTVRAMENPHAVLEKSGLGFGDVVQTRIYLTNMSDWTTVNGIYGSYFKDGYPARVTVQVAGLPKVANVAIERVAQKREG